MYIECIRTSGADGADYDVLVTALKNKTKVSGFYMSSGNLVDNGITDIDKNDVAKEYDKVSRKKLLLHNIQMSDATLIFYPKKVNNDNPLSDLSKLIKDVDKPVFYFIVGVTKFSDLTSWLRRYNVKELNVIGPGIGNSTKISMLIHRLTSTSF